MALDPAPLNAVPRLADEVIELLPKLDVLHRLLARRAPALGFPAMDPFSNALAHVLAVQVQRDGAGALQGREGLDHGLHLYAVIGRVQGPAPQLFFNAAGAQQHAPAPGPRDALAGAVGVNLNFVQTQSL